MDIEEKLKQSQARLQATINTINGLESIGKPTGQLPEYAIRTDERVKVYKEILEDKTTVQNDFPESLYKQRELYQTQHHSQEVRQ